MVTEQKRMAGTGGWVEVAVITDLEKKRMKVVHPKGVSVLLVEHQGDVFALSNRCPHLGCPLSSGTLSGHIITCPCHDWSFDIRTGGLMMAPEVTLKRYHTRGSEGKISVRLED